MRTFLDSICRFAPQNGPAFDASLNLNCPRRSGHSQDTLKDPRFSYESTKNRREECRHDGDDGVQRVDGNCEMAWAWDILRRDGHLQDVGI
jgi:hypothetical protein